MNTLPAVPDATAGEVTGRVGMLPTGDLVLRLRPARTRDVTTRPAPRETRRQHSYRSCGPIYVGPLTPTMRAELGALRARFMDPPWWSPLTWRPVHRRARADLLSDPACRQAPVLELRPVKEGAKRDDLVQH